MQEICSKSVESARTEALIVCKKYNAGIKFCVIIIGIIMLIVLFAMETSEALIVDVMLLIIGFLAVVPISSRYIALNKSVEKLEPVICKAQGTGFERMGKRAVPVVYFEFEGSKGWAVTFEEKNTHIIAEGDYLYVWHNNKKKRLYLAIYAGV